MSSIRLFILAGRAPARVGSLYGAIRRLTAEELIEEIRVERVGAYPQRQGWAITDAGGQA